MTKPVGLLLMWIGFFAAAFVSVYRLEVSGDKWATVPWLWYGLSMAVGVVGVILLRRSNRQSDDHDEEQLSSYTSLVQAIETLCTNLQRLLEDQETIDPAQVVIRIDEQLAGPFADFADGRKALASRFGLQFYADVMTQFASGERFVNRAWCAAADGYIDEVDASLTRASEHLRKAQALMAGK